MSSLFNYTFNISNKNIKLTAVPYAQICPSCNINISNYERDTSNLGCHSVKKIWNGCSLCINSTFVQIKDFFSFQ